MRLSEQANERLWDALLTEVLIEDCKNELAELEAAAEPYTFSSNFVKKIQKIRRSVGRRELAIGITVFVRKAAVTAAVIMGVLFIGFLTQPKVYAAVEDVVRSVFDNHDKYTYQGEPAKGTFDEYKRLGYVPDGYELRSIVYGKSIAALTYENADEETIDFDYGFADSVSISIDNERHDYKRIRCNGQTYYVYSAIEKSDKSTIIWYDDDYIYSIDAQLSESELIKIAENVKK